MFSSTAVLYSNDPGSSSKGGEFDWVTRGTFVPEFDRAAFKIKEGEVSEVFETDYGYHILELFERRGDQYRGRHILLIPKIWEISCRRKLRERQNDWHGLTVRPMKKTGRLG